MPAAAAASSRPAGSMGSTTRGGGGAVPSPLPAFPIAAYVFGAALGVLSVIGGDRRTWSREMWHAATFVIIGGAAVSVFAALTVFLDWLRSSEQGTQARRTANTHATIMLTVTVLTLANIALRLNSYHTEKSTPRPIVILSVVVALLVSWGATYGGTLGSWSCSPGGCRSRSG